MDTTLAPTAGSAVGPPTAGSVRRAAWSFAGQAASSGSNFLLSVLVLSVATAAEFATFSLCIMTYALVLQLVRAAVAVPATLLQTGEADADDAQRAAAVAVTVAASGVAAAAMVAASVVGTGTGRSLLAVIGLSLPVLLYQDALRYACYAWGRPSVATVSDVTWLTLQAVFSALLFAVDRESPTGFLAVWAAGGVVTGLATGAYLRLTPRFTAARTWLRSHRDLWQRLLGEFVVASSSHQAVWYGLAIVAGAGELGRVKAAQTLLGPLVVLVLGGSAFGVPESVRAAHDRQRLRFVALRLSAFLVATAVVCGVAAYALVPTFGPALFPNSWETARPLIPLLTAFTAALGASLGPTAALRALDQNQWLLRVRATSGAAVVLLGVAASARFDAPGAVATVVAAEAVVGWLAWRRLAQATAVASTT